MKTKPEKTIESASSAWSEIESNLNFILQHLKDAKEVGNIQERAEEIERHSKRIKSLYDWMDSFCTFELY